MTFRNTQSWILKINSCGFTGNKILSQRNCAICQLIQHPLARLESNPFLILGQNGNLRLHLDVVKCGIVMTSQVISVVVVVNRFVLLRLDAELLHEWIQRENFALVGNRLNVVLVLVR